MDLSVAGKFVKLCPIRESDISLINRWYQQDESFRYAAGEKKPEDIVIQIKQPSRFTSFVSGIYRTGDNICIGMIAGEFKKHVSRCCGLGPSLSIPAGGGSITELRLCSFYSGIRVKFIKRSVFIFQ